MLLNDELEAGEEDEDDDEEHIVELIDDAVRLDILELGALNEEFNAAFDADWVDDWLGVVDDDVVELSVMYEGVEEFEGM